MSLSELPAGNNPRGFSPSLDKRKVLAGVVRNAAEQLRRRNDGDEIDEGIREAAELIKVLARLLEGRDVYQAFGAPGDWGYETVVGQELAKAYRN